MRQLTSLDYGDAGAMIDAIHAEVVRRKKAAAIAVTDPYGEIIALARMDGTPITGYDISCYGDPRIVGWGGGIPVLREGKVVGAVAVSGLPQAEDMEVAALGAAAIGG